MTRKGSIAAITAFTLGAGLFASLTVAQSVTVAQLGGCLLDAIGRPVCAPPNGGIAEDSIGRVVCGSGQCVVDGIGRVLCSSVPGGGAIVDSIGSPRCVGGCEEATERTCVAPRR